MTPDIQKKKTLLLINPVSQFRHGFSQDQTSKHPPLALAIIASYTPANWKIRILDENFQAFHFREADLVGITSFTPSAPRAYEIAQVYRQKGIPVVYGGIHASMCPEEALNYVDAVVVGEAESVWQQLIADFEVGQLQKIYRGSFRDMVNLPLPRHDLFHPGYVFHSVQTSRGCPMDCDFCTVTAFNGQHFRVRPVNEILDELESFKGDNRAIFFVDDNICGMTKSHQERAIELFKGIIDRGIKINWFSQTSLNIADNEELLRLAAKSGCRILLIGIESETLEGLKSANKLLNVKKGVENYQKIFKKINKHGIAVLGTFIFGLETDTVESIRKRADYILKSKVDCVQTSILTPLPGTHLYHRMKDQNRITCKDFPHDWQYFHFADIVFRHPRMAAEDMAPAMTAAWKRIYHPTHLLTGFLRTWWNTRSLTAAVWSYQTNIHYRNIVFEREIWYSRD
jgi:radical SAM superfamily enzyme YgiQ (UPF0313 family)